MLGRSKGWRLSMSAFLETTIELPLERTRINRANGKVEGEILLDSSSKSKRRQRSICPEATGPNEGRPLKRGVVIIYVDNLCKASSRTRPKKSKRTA